ncbi:MAG: carbohydrate ABC transporter permease, partial [Mobilitalea sp.]
YPLLYGVFISFYKTNLANKWDFIGLKNYSTIFLDKSFLTQLWITLKFTFIVVVAHFIIGTILALVLNQKRRGIIFFRAILVLPWLFPEVVVALIFKWIMNPIYGLLNNALISLGIITENISWLGTSKYAFFTVVVVCIWKG